jgi:hypothetical protein
MHTDLGERYLALNERLPHLNVLGGCCGTEHRHSQAATGPGASTSPTEVERLLEIGERLAGEAPAIASPSGRPPELA